MRAFVGFSQASRTDVRVDLCRCQALMSEQLLNAAEIGSAVEHVAGKTVSERVRRGQLVQSGGGDVFFQQATHAAGCQAATKAIQEDRLPFVVGQVACRFPDLQPGQQCPGCETADRRNPLLASLAEYAEDVAVAIPVGRV